MKLHCITGLPRSGSTLLCNLLAQNKQLRVSSTSWVPGLLDSLSLLSSASSEIKSELAHDRDITERRLRATAQGAVDGWYGGDKRIVIDKSRMWSHVYQIAQSLWPAMHFVVMVRDLRAVFGSIEKQHARFPMLDIGVSHANDRLVATRYQKCFDPQTGMIGLPLQGVTDLLRRGESQRVTYLKYEDFVIDPLAHLKILYRKLGAKWYRHNPHDVKPTAIDLDALYLYKFPHEGCGKIETRSDDWRDWVPSDIAAEIMTTHSQYNAAFGYAD